MRRSTVAALVLACSLLPAALAAPPVTTPAGPLMRFPDIHGGQAVFVLGEDLWTAPVAGGTAVRLTAHEGEERSPRFSPDGSLVAFTAEYDGNQDVFVMNPAGGAITRVTYHPGTDEVLGWHPVTKKILFRSGRNSWTGFSRLFLIAPDGTGLEELPLPEAAWGAYSPDGTKIVYTRVATEGRTWKRYRGGLAPDVYVYDFTSGKDRRLTDFRGTDRFPLWVGQKIYFVSDRDGTLNLWSIDPAGGDAVQVTRHADYDVTRPATDGTSIVYELGGTLQVLDIATGTSRRLPVEVKADLNDTRAYWRSVANQVTEIGVSPGGERALLVARGEVFTVPRKDGPARNLTADAGARDRGAAWSPDGTRVAFVSDRGGEYDLWVVDERGKGPATRLTTSSKGYRKNLRWSPDGKKIAYADDTLRLFVVDVASKAVTEVDKAEYEPMDIGLEHKPIDDAAWSPDSRFLAYSKLDANLVSGLWIWSLEGGKSVPASGGFWNDFGPVFSADGKYLFFVSNRAFDPTYCDFEFQLVYKKAAGIYALSLTKDTPPLLPLKDDEIAAKKDEPRKDDAKKDEKKAEPAPKVAVDAEGLARRVEQVPLPRGNYRELAASKADLFWLDAEDGDFNRIDLRDRPSRTLGAFHFEDRKSRTVATKVDDYALAAGGEKIALRSGEQVSIIDAAASEAKPEPLDLSGLRMRIDPRAEWKQIFEEAWRLERDFFYDPAMHGVDWNAVHVKYGRLLPFAGSRQDLRILIGEMIAELNTSHTYVFGGEARRHAESVGVGMLGADFVADTAAGRFKIARILAVPEWIDTLVPPLAAAGVDVREGEYLLKVDGAEVTTGREVYAYFQDLAGRQITLTVGADPKGTGAREVRVKAAGDEGRMRYLDWVERNRRTVDQASGGTIGYMHLPDTYTGAARMFPPYFYAQTQKQGLVIDGRFNGGGLDPDVFLDRLSRPVEYYWTRRHSADYTTPLVSTRAHMALITNRQAGSGGDMLPAEFRLRGMGPLVGTRSWGGLVGISAFLEMIDGSGLSAPDYRIYDTSGKFVIENEGVTPDYEVDLDPAEMARGFDAQLMKAVEVVKAAIAKDPRPRPKRPPFQADPTLKP